MPSCFLIFVFFVVFVLLIPLSHPGGDLMFIPFNVFILEIISGFIFVSFLLIYKKNEILVPRYMVLIIAMPLLLSISILFSGVFDRDVIVRLLAIYLGVFFFISLFQFEVNKRVVDDAVYVLIFGLLLVSLTGLLQILPGRLFEGFVKHPRTPQINGVFMQPNLMASAMVTAVLLSIYQITTPGFKKRNFSIKMIVFIMIFMGVLTVTGSGSRVGLLGLLVSLVLMFLARKSIFRKFRLQTSFLALTILMGAVSGALVSDGLWRAYSKVERLGSFGSEIRLHMYNISVNMYLDKPIGGYGIGRFEGNFHNAAAVYMEDKGEGALLGNSRYNHPHNEILLWAVEGGTIALLGLLAAAVAVMHQLYRLGWERGGAYFSLLFPIALHTQTELPFYSSIFHWFLFLFLLFIVFRSGVKSFLINKKYYSMFFPVFGSFVLIFALVFCTGTFNASRRLSEFILYGNYDLSNIEEAKKSYYFNEFATRLYLKMKLNEELINGGEYWTRAYIEWISSYLNKHPSVSAYHDLSLAYKHIGEPEKAEEVLNHAIYLFPEHPVVLMAIDKL